MALSLYMQFVCCHLVDGEWNSWGQWGDCSKTCGDGQQTRNRTCDNSAAAHGGDPCDSEAFETRQCKVLECPGKLLLSHNYIFEPLGSTNK